MKIKNVRIRYTILFVLTIIIGLFSRSSYIPDLIYPYIGDLFYAVMMYWIFAFLLPKERSFKVAVYAVGLCFAIEVFQLYQAEWINTIRHTLFGRLVLGSGFLWSDLVCYCLGGLIGYYIDQIFIKDRR